MTAFAYTASGQLESLTDAENQTTSYTYDDAGQKLTEVYPDHVPSATIGSPGYGIVSFTYDPAGRVEEREDQQGDTCTYSYDLAGRLESRDYVGHSSGPLSGQSATDSFTYDAASRMLTAVSGRYANTVTYTYDDGGRKATEGLTIAGQTYTIETDYDAAGQLTGYTYPDGTLVARSYTDRGQLHELSFDSTVVDTRTYDDGGRMTGSAYNNGVSETRAYNTDNTLSSISYTGASIGTYSYGWDANKNKTSESISGTLAGYGFTVGASGYDTEDRLVNWERSDSALDQSWNLSLVGDWNSITENTVAQARTHGDAHELLTAGGSAVSHDAKGNQTLIPATLSSSALALNWDFENKLTTADVGNDSSVDVTYKWDALGRRVFRDDGTSAVVYVQSGEQTLADYGSGVAASTPMYRYVWASYIDEPVVRVDSSDAKLYYHRNQQYSVVALTDSVGAIQERYAYTAYGEPTVLDGAGTALSASAEDNRYTYTGREWDGAMSLYHYRSRMYSPVAGRFVSRDGASYVDGASLYGAYFGLAAGDPLGRACTPLGPTGPATTSGFAASGGFSITTGTNPGVWSYAMADKIVCTATHTQTFIYSCSCFQWLPCPGWVSSAMAVTVTEDESFTLPGALELVHTVTAPLPGGIPKGPGLGLNFGFLHPDDQAGANTRCKNAASSRTPTVSPPTSVSCP
ncbi:RHS repeat-associated core domain-containing protein [Candidatus Laterigemmans baculatus]|uniref:RHS repeat-associated core domain-containing protein n=1 Tax=Candidatus Laterigemmans baculatus TaxID=2770505 RepID=UPI0013DD0FFE|nr:RHS repeat-associated core domain-containing protein [Candidatus Laterigemmans baculatus]